MISDLSALDTFIRKVMAQLSVIRTITHRPGLPVHGKISLGFDHDVETLLYALQLRSNFPESGLIAKVTFNLRGSRYEYSSKLIDDNSSTYTRVHSLWSIQPLE